VDRQGLLDTAREEADRLNRLVGNLLDMTRIEAGAIQVRREYSDVLDVIGTALEMFKDPLDDHPVKVDVPDDLPLVPMDFVLIERVLVNVLDNAIKFSPAQAPIDIQARLIGNDLEINILDRGPGIPTRDLERIFDKFYRVQRPGNVKGTGLGLSICKGMVEAHGGTIYAKNRSDGGAIVTIVLPLKFNN
jgi:two-component system sensor histidine kinase KdpD